MHSENALESLQNMEKGLISSSTKQFDFMPKSYVRIGLAGVIDLLLSRKPEMLVEMFFLLAQIAIGIALLTLPCIGF